MELSLSASGPSVPLQQGGKACKPKKHRASPYAAELAAAEAKYRALRDKDQEWQKRTQREQELQAAAMQATMQATMPFYAGLFPPSAMPAAFQFAAAPAVLRSGAAAAPARRREDKKVAEAKKEPETCVICLSDLTRDNVDFLPCMHAFHRDCIERWRQQKNECPVCKENPSKKVRIADLGKASKKKKKSHKQ